MLGSSRKSAAAPASTIRPFSRTYARWATSSATSTSCSTSSMAVPAEWMSFTTSISRSTILGASPRDISSTIRSFGRAIRPRPIATICCSPPESVRASRFSLSLRAGKYSSTLRTSVSMSPSRRAYAPSRKFFSTDIVSKSRRPWGTCAIPALTMASGRAFVISRPENAMLRAHADGHAHDVLDQDDGHAALVDGPDHLERVIDLHRVEPGHHLVEQQQLRSSRHGPGDLKPFAVRDGHSADRQVRLRSQADQLEHAVGASESRPEPGPFLIAAKQRTRHDVLANRHRGEGLDDLKSPADTEPCHPEGSQPGDRFALPSNVPAVKPVHPADAVEQRGLARAVRPDDAEDLPFPNREPDIVDGSHAAQALGDVLQLELRIHRRHTEVSRSDRRR